MKRALSVFVLAGTVLVSAAEALPPAELLENLEFFLDYEVVEQYEMAEEFGVSIDTAPVAGEEAEVQEETQDSENVKEESDHE